MKKLLMVPILALGLAGITPVAQAAGTNTSGELAGTDCGATASMWDGAAGVLQPGEADWYDASYSEAENRTLEVEVTAPGWPLGQGTQIAVYEWDTATNTCTLITKTFCDLNVVFIGHVPEVFNIRPCWDVEHIPGVPFIYNRPPGGTIDLPGPGDYQVMITNDASLIPTAYTVAEED